MIAAAEPAPCRRIRLNRYRGPNQYQLKERFASLCAERSITVLTLGCDESNAWTEEKNRRRCHLIDKSLQSELTAAEQNELTLLQQHAEDHLDEIAPPPMQGALLLHSRLLRLAGASDK